jgi:hypothetical protein
MIPRFFSEVMEKKQHIPNIDPTHIQKLMVNGKIPIENFLVACVGTRNGIKVCELIRVLACKNTPFVGIHLIEHNFQKILIKSFLDFRNNYLKFNDNNAFDRSSFIIDEKEEIYARIQPIRHLIQIPLNPYLTTKNFNNVEEQTIEITEKTNFAIYDLCLRIHHLKQHMFQHYTQDFANEAISRMISNAIIHISKCDKFEDNIQSIIQHSKYIESTEPNIKKQKSLDEEIGDIWDSIANT